MPVYEDSRCARERARDEGMRRLSAGPDIATAAQPFLCPSKAIAIRLSLLAIRWPSCRRNRSPLWLGASQVQKQENPARNRHPGKIAGSVPTSRLVAGDPCERHSVV